jgi:hypothetical protein
MQLVAFHVVLGVMVLNFALLIFLPVILQHVSSALKSDASYHPSMFHLLPK